MFKKHVLTENVETEGVEEPPDVEIEGIEEVPDVEIAITARSKDCGVPFVTD